MIDVVLTHNGIGRGHLIRSLRVCRWLRRAGRRPVIFHQGAYPEWAQVRVPGVGIPRLYQLPPASAQLAADEIVRYAQLAGRSVVFEDTHPAPVSWPPEVTRFLTVRPVAFELARELQRDHAGDCASVMLCDDPGSPTWPYGPEQTRELLGLGRWQAIGPIFQRPTPSGVQRVRKRHRIGPGDTMFVFSMGAGGQRLGSEDCPRFVRAAADLGAELGLRHPGARLMFIRGPLFPRAIEIPDPFEVIDTEPDLPSLLALAAGAVIRPGFNLVWECIAASTPMLAITGTTYREPVLERIEGLRRHGIDVVHGVERWSDPRWVAEYRSACRRTLDRFSGDPANRFLTAVTAASKRPAPRRASARTRQPRAHTDHDAYNDLRRAATAIPRAKQLLVRIDDIAAITPTLTWIIHACRSRNLRPSLEVIPYLASITERDLDRIDPTAICEVSQHGYAHIPGWFPGTRRRGEFAVQAPAAPPEAARLLRRGHRFLGRAFAGRFRGGYSPPYDGMPAWLPGLWSSLDGRYISWIATPPPPHEHLAHVQLSIDPWDWQRDRPKSAQSVAMRSLRALGACGSVGVVLHPQCLHEREQREDLERLLDALIAGGCRGRAVSEAADVHPDSGPRHSAALGSPVPG
jgi:hypothetical protein